MHLLIHQILGNNIQENSIQENSIYLNESDLYSLVLKDKNK